MDLIPDQHEGAWYRVCVGLVYMIQCGYRDALYISFDQTQLGSEIKNIFFLCCKKQALLSFVEYNFEGGKQLIPGFDTTQSAQDNAKQIMTYSSTIDPCTTGLLGKRRQEG